MMEDSQNLMVRAAYKFWHTAIFKCLAWLERQGHEIGASESKLRSKTLISDICSHFPSEHRESLQVLLQR